MLAQPPFWFIVIAFLCALGPLVVFHELGHYWVARWLGVGAEQFSIGFGREVAGWTDKRGTRWKVGWLPLGGYVGLSGI
jgi:regulator of sigma E protease